MPEDRRPRESQSPDVTGLANVHLPFYIGRMAGDCPKP